MPFIVPKFIERKPKVIGPFTFQQFIFVGTAGAICLILYFSAPFYVFLAGSFILGGGGIILAFGKINGRSIPLAINNFFNFQISSKIYLWKKRSVSPKLIKVGKMEKVDKKRVPTLSITEKSKLKNLSVKIETGQR